MIHTIECFCSNEVMQSVGIMKNASEMENQIFSKSNTPEDYRQMVGKLIIHLQSKYISRLNAYYWNMGAWNAD